MNAGSVAASWRENRRIFALATATALPLVDIEQQSTWNVLESALNLPAEVPHLDIGHVFDHLDRDVSAQSKRVFSAGQP